VCTVCTSLCVFFVKSVYVLQICTLVCNRKTIGELCEDAEVVRSTDSTFGNLEMTFKLNKASIIIIIINYLFVKTMTEVKKQYVNIVQRSKYM